MWRDYFSFTKRERVAIWTFTVIIVILQSVIWTSSCWLPYLKSKMIVPEDSVCEVLPGNVEKAGVYAVSKKDSISGFAGKRKSYSRKRKKSAEAHTNLHTSKIKKSFRKKPDIIEINSADSSSLISLRGIGSYTAKRIIKYRDRLGGFYSLTQIDEIYGLYPEQIDVIKHHIKIDTSLIRKMNINVLGLYALKCHPYIDYYQAKTIVKLRNARGRIASIKELLEFSEFTVQDVSRLRPYISLNADK